jgi:predicted MPP superfamily phosphohydrolase
MKRTSAWIAGIIVMLATLGGATIAIGIREAASTPIERHLSVELSGWPGDVSPLRVALLSDIHLGNRAMSIERLNSIVEQVNAARPDLILAAGDFLVGHDALGASERAAGLEVPLSRLNAPLGVIAVLGNHDHWTAPDAVRDALNRARVTVLENRAVRRGLVTVIGVDDAFSGHDDFESASASAARIGGIPIVLTHSPDLVHKMRRGFPIVLAGHTHCGQVVLPWYGPLLTRAPRENWRPLYDVRYRCGVVRDTDRVVVVSAGLGSGSSPVRLGAPPDWWLLTVGPQRDKAHT